VNGSEEKKLVDDRGESLPDKQQESADVEQELFRLRRKRAQTGFTPNTDSILEGPLNEEVHAEDKIFHLFSVPRPRHWSVVWSDLMMTMFILFASLYIFQMSNRDLFVPKQLGPIEEKTASPDQIGSNGGFGAEISTGNSGPGEVYDLSQQVINEAELDDFANINLAADKTVRIILTGDLLFDTGDVTLKTAAKKKLQKIAALLRLSPYVINVIGHTDNIPIHTPAIQSNWELSVLRATAVARYLIDDLKFPGNRFYVSGHARFQPIAGNYSLVYRAKNRRVEIVITRQMPGGSYVLEKE